MYPLYLYHQYHAKNCNCHFLFRKHSLTPNRLWPDPGAQRVFLHPKIHQTKMLATSQRFGISFFIWAGLAVFFSPDKMIKVGSKSWLLTCSSNITLSLPSYTSSALKREQKFCYLSLLYFCLYCWTQNDFDSSP